MNWRRVNRAVHRDLGYLCAGLTVVYALTGVLLNHLPTGTRTGRLERVAARAAPPPAERFAEADLARILAELGSARSQPGRSSGTPTTLQIFFDAGRALSVDLPTGGVEGEIVRERRLLTFLDNLHLNRAGQAWTWLADPYAAALGLLALTGLFVLKGKGRDHPPRRRARHGRARDPGAVSAARSLKTRANTACAAAPVAYTPGRIDSNLAIRSRRPDISRASRRRTTPASARK